MLYLNDVFYIYSYIVFCMLVVVNCYNIMSLGLRLRFFLLLISKGYFSKL